MNVIRGYSFDDVLLVPKKSKIGRRAQIDVSTDLGRGIVLQKPIVSANMKHVTGHDMAFEIAINGGMALLHRFESEEDRFHSFLRAIRLSDNRWPAMQDEKQADDWMPDRQTYDLCRKIGMSFGINNSEKAFFSSVTKRLGDNLKIVCIDVAHGHHDNCLRMIEHVRKEAPHVLIIAGNVATVDGAVDILYIGADVIKVGVGPGSLCTTRVETGNGVPQLTALANIYETLQNIRPHPNVKIIADGGVKCAGDMVKALCFSDAVMLGNLLAGTDQAPGEIITLKGQKYKQYAGSSTHKTRNIEGVIGTVPYRGDVNNVVDRLVQGLQSGMSYQGAENLKSLRNEPQFVEISNAGIVESRPHDVIL